MHGSRGCLGFCTKPVDEPSKGMKIQGQIVRKQSVTDDFWSTSTCEMDNSALQSHGSVSTLSTSNPPLDPHNSVGSMSNPTEFVNHGKFKLIYFSCCLLLATMAAYISHVPIKVLLNSLFLTHHCKIVLFEMSSRPRNLKLRCLSIFL
ncbi:hypothetical protein CsSME_00043979 [Camellia sinensis var. sinensis]